MRGIIIGSSMTMPSPELLYEDTWHYNIVKKYSDIEFIDKNVRSSSAKRLVLEGILNNGMDLLELYNPDFVITQIGATDAYPRLLKRDKIYTKIINHLPKSISNFIYNIVRKVKGRTISCCDLSLLEF